MDATSRLAASCTSSCCGSAKDGTGADNGMLTLSTVTISSSLGMAINTGPCGTA
ncbi:hypothetical protein ACFLVR_02675 [Chloroflexota bacterium]